MRPVTRDVLTAWTIGTAALIAAALLFTSCAHPYPTEAADSYSAVEMALVDHTARFADQLGVRVKGVITDKMHAGLAQSNPTAWYDAGIAYYYRPNVERYVRLVPTPGCETAVNVAAHEVCHAKYRAHDLAHWTCNNTLAQATYPRPE